MVIILSNLLTDLQNVFTGRFLGKFAVNCLLTTAPLLALLPHYLVKH